MIRVYRKLTELQVVLIIVITTVNYQPGMFGAPRSRATVIEGKLGP